MINVFVSRRREYEFGLAFGSTMDWLGEMAVWHFRLSFGKRSVVFAFRIKGENK